MENIKFKLEVECTITQQDIDNLMVAALEGGINYWCEEVIIDTYPDNVDPLTTDLYVSDMISRGGVLNLITLEDEKEFLLDLPSFIEGVRQFMLSERVMSIEELMDNHDANTADTIIQYALFNEIVFG